jgi:hypothetical protein
MLRRYLPDILSDRNVKRRANKVRALMPDVFDNAYRTYDEKLIGSVTKGTLTAIRPTEQDEADALKLAQQDGYPIDSLDELPESKQLEYLNKAVIDRALQTVPKGKQKKVPSRRGPTQAAQQAQQARTDKEAQMTPPTPPPQGMQPIPPEQAVPPPPPPPDSGPDELGGATPAPTPTPPPQPTSPGRRKAPGPVKKLPGREPPTPPPQTPPKTPTDLSSPQKRGAAGALDRKRRRDFEKGLDQQQGQPDESP